MINNKKIVVVLPAYNASETLAATVNEIPLELVDEIILTDDASDDDTFEIAQKLKITYVIKHKMNLGYGANQKTCYKKALEIGADIVIMLHPDYQYTPKLIPSMAYLIANGMYSVVLGSRILGGKAVKGGMPVYKYIANRFLTFFQNVVTGAKLSEYHTGYRAYSAEVLRKVNWIDNSNDFIFDNEMLSQIIYMKNPIAEISCPTKYFKEASSINFFKSVQYGLGVIRVSLQHLIQRIGLFKFKMYQTRE